MATWPYTTRRWQRLRRAKLRRDPLCALCLPRIVAASDVDHVQAINDGGDPWHWSNLRSLCHACHSRKTRYIEQLGRERIPVKGCDAHGLPLDPAHPWRLRSRSATQRHEKLLGADGEERPAAAPQT